MTKPNSSTTEGHRLKYPLDDPNSHTYVKGDPITEQFKIILNNNPDQKMKLYIMQYFGRDKTEPPTYLNKGQGISEFRFKPKSGHVQVDINIDPNMNYDRERGESYGNAIRESSIIQSGGSYGLVGGFGMSTDARKGEKSTKTSAKADRDIEMADLNIPYPAEGPEKMDVDHPYYWVFNRLTVGGRIQQRKPTDPIYFLGTFVKGNELHLTPIDALIQMTTQFDHCDAEDNLMKVRKARETQSKEAGGENDSGDDSSSNGNSDKDVEPADDDSVVEELPVPGEKSKGKGSDDGVSDGDDESERDGGPAVNKKGKAPARRQPRAIQMSAKTVRLDGEDTDMTKTAKTLRGFQEEDWIRMAYADEDTDESWDVYREKCILRNAEAATALKAAQTEGRWLGMIGTPKKSVFEDSWIRRQARQAKEWGFGFDDGEKPQMIDQEEMDAKLKSKYPNRFTSRPPTQVEIWEAQQEKSLPYGKAPYFDADYLYVNSSSDEENVQEEEGKESDDDDEEEEEDEAGEVEVEYEEDDEVKDDAEEVIE